MNWLTFVLVLISVSLSAAAQLLLKAGVTGRLKPDSHFLHTLAAVALNPYVFGGFCLYGFGAVVWLYVLARVDVSVAYPFVGIGFILTMLCGYLLFGEVINASRILGTCLVGAGIILIARS